MSSRVMPLADLGEVDVGEVPGRRDDEVGDLVALLDLVLLGAPAVALDLRALRGSSPRPKVTTPSVVWLRIARRMMLPGLARRARRPR